METHGICEDDVCGRNGCTGIIVRDDSDYSCSCHINPPCSDCVEEREYCPECGWDVREE